MPVTNGVIVNVSAPVPPATVNAKEESARPKVVVMADPPLRTNGGLTVMTKEIVDCAEAESVTVIVSRYVP
ncbi:unannotated protein [freshwater metagenome]|uniref:Unannotated protein n=1 Tax=freshwater metagenome TaxID=449393 RepID=A0A6J7KUF0_9ZZZZ